MSEARLAVTRDGVDLPEEQARALWRAFSEHMERNEHDLEGFARDHGFASVRAEHRRGRAVLIISTSVSAGSSGDERSSFAPARPSRPTQTPTRASAPPRKARPSVPAARRSSGGTGKR